MRLRQLCHHARQTPNAVSTLLDRRLREKERKQAEKEARALRKAAAGGAKNTLDTFINRVTYKVGGAGLWAPALMSWVAMKLWQGRCPFDANKLWTSVCCTIPHLTQYQLYHVQPAIHADQQAKVAVGVKDTASDRPPIGHASPQKKQRTPTKPVSLLESLLHNSNLHLCELSAEACP